jgi:hypothetical protein
MQQESDVATIAKTLAAHGGGAASFDLALDLILNEVVEQARLATGATGAAVALARDGEMVCRATTGADAPDLGFGSRRDQACRERACRAGRFSNAATPRPTRG